MVDSCVRYFLDIKLNDINFNRFQTILIFYVIFYKFLNNVFINKLNFKNMILHISNSNSENSRYKICAACSKTHV